MTSPQGNRALVIASGIAAVGFAAFTVADLANADYWQAVRDFAIAC